jgi:hypothetical protein
MFLFQFEKVEVLKSENLSVNWGELGEIIGRFLNFLKGKKAKSKKPKQLLRKKTSVSEIGKENKRSSKILPSPTEDSPKEKRDKEKT